MNLLPLSATIIGTLSNDDDDGIACENIRFLVALFRWGRFTSPAAKSEEKRMFSQANDGNENVPKKMNLRSFKPNCVYWDPLNMSNAVQVQKEEGKFVVVCPRPP